MKLLVIKTTACKSKQNEATVLVHFKKKKHIIQDVHVFLSSVEKK